MYKKQDNYKALSQDQTGEKPVRVHISQPLVAPDTSGTAGKPNLTAAVMEKQLGCIRLSLK